MMINTPIKFPTPKPFSRAVCLLLATILILGFSTSTLAEPIPVNKIDRTTPVDFQKEIFPFLKRNCLSCHNQQDADADLILESPKTIAKGSESGEVIDLADPELSLLVRVAAHVEKPYMPPKKNKVDAVNLTPEQLGLLQLWIKQGAGGEMKKTEIKKPTWQEIPKSFKAVYALALSNDAQYLAAGRRNEIYIYHLPSQKLITKLNDPAFAKINRTGAHRDMIQSLAFNNNGTMLASGGYRSIKLWEINPNPTHWITPPLDPKGLTASALSSDGITLAVAGPTGTIHLINAKTGEIFSTFPAQNNSPVTALTFSGKGVHLVAGYEDKHIRVWHLVDGKIAHQIATPTPLRALAPITGEADIAAGGTDGVIRLYQTPSATAEPLKLIRELKAHTKPIRTLTPIDAGKGLLSGADDNTARQWNTAANEPLRTFQFSSPVSAIAITADMKRIALAGDKAQITIYNADDAKPLINMAGDGILAQREQYLKQKVQFVANDLNYWKDVQLKGELAQKNQAAQLVKISSEKEAALKNVTDKQTAVQAATTNKQKADQTLATTKNNLNQTKAEVANLQNKLKQLQTQLAAAKTMRDQAQTALKTTTDTLAKYDAQLKKHQAELTTTQQAHRASQTNLKNTQDRVTTLIKEVETARTTLAGLQKAFNEAMTAQAAAQAAVDQATKDNAPDLPEKQKQLEQATATLNQRKAELAAAQTNLTKTETELKTQTEEQTKLTTQLKQTEEKLKAQQAKLAESQKAYEATKANQTKADAELKQRTAAYQKIEAEQKTTNETLAVKNKAVTDLTNGLKAADAAVKQAAKAIQDAQKALAAANNQRQQAELKLMQTMAVSRNVLNETQDKLDQRLAVERRVTRLQDELNQLTAELTRSHQTITHLQFTKDQQHLISTSKSGIINTWFAPTGQPVTHIKHDTPLTSATLIADNAIIATNAKGQTVSYPILPAWQLKSRIEGTERNKPRISDRVLSLDFHPDGEWLLMSGGTPSQRGELKIFSVHDGTLVRDIVTEHLDTINTARFSPDGTMIATGGSDKVAATYDTLTGNRIKLYEGHTNYVLGVGWAKHNRMLATAGADHVLKLWDVKSGNQIRSVGGYNKQITNVEFVGYSESFIAAAGDTQIKQIQPDGKVIRGFGGAGDFIHSLTISGNGNLVAAGTQDGIIRVWQVADGKLLYEFKDPAQ